MVPTRLTHPFHFAFRPPIASTSSMTAPEASLPSPQISSRSSRAGRPQIRRTDVCNPLLLLFSKTSTRVPRCYRLVNRTETRLVTRSNPWRTTRASALASRSDEHAIFSINDTRAPTEPLVPRRLPGLQTLEGLFLRLGLGRLFPATVPIAGLPRPKTPSTDRIQRRLLATDFRHRSSEGQRASGWAFRPSP